MVRTLLFGLLIALVVGACGQEEDNADNRNGADGTNLNDQQLLALVEDPPRPIDDFTLSSTTGEPFTLSEQTGKLSLIYFGFTSCPDVCPNTLSELRRAYVDLGEPADKVNIIMITVDPERDQPENMERFLGLYHPDFFGLYGSDDELAAVQDSFDVIAVREEMGDSALGYNITHTASIFVVSPQGELIAIFAHGATAFTIAHDLRILLETEF